MLKSLELIGFKSFADPTRLEFGEGLTAIVGPNGSGKSNLVDAIRWVLGEQSAKSMRGHEMADVIFNGSATRRSLGMAEVSLTLDNRKRLLPMDSDDVVLTRRVYRDGQGEYLINGELARLRDIRDLFLGTGAADGAYSIIEQGKVDLLLQASSKDRRHIFEEAAGTSKLRARKTEAMRRLDQIEQNLQRVQDIHDEVDKHVRGLRSQAGKARKYQEYAERLKQLRLTLGGMDCRRYSSELAQLEQTGAELSGRIHDAETQLVHTQAKHDALDAALTEREESVREVVGRLTAVREQISALEAELAADRDRDLELAGELTDSGERLARTESRRQALERRFDETDAARSNAAHAIEEQRRALVARSESIQNGRARLGELQAELAEIRQRAAEALRERTHYENESAELQRRRLSLEAHGTQCQEKAGQLIRELRRLSRQSSHLRDQHGAVRAQLRSCQHVMGRHHGELGRQRQIQADKAQALADLNARRIAVQSRIEVLAQLHERHEGLEGGVKQALERKAAGDPVWQCVMDALIRCIRVDAKYADWIELAVGSRSQALVVASLDALTDALLEQARQLPGRVEFLALDGPEPSQLMVVDERIHWPPLSSWVESDERLRPLVERLLGTTFLADDYASARRAVGESVGLRFLTPTGEILEPDGRIAAGPPRCPTGILSRAAELRDLTAQLARLDDERREQQAALASVEDAIARIDSACAEAAKRFDRLEEQQGHLAGASDRVRRKRERAVEEFDEVALRQRELSRQVAEMERREQFVAHALEVARQTFTELSAEAARLEAIAAQHEQALARTEREARSTELDLAVANERLSSLQAELKRLDADRTRLELDGVKEKGHWDQLAARREAIAARLLANAGAVARLYGEKERLAATDGYDPAALEAMRRERLPLAEQVRQWRARLEHDRETLHQLQLRATEMRLNRDALVARLREDYSVDLLACPADETGGAEIPDVEPYRHEIDDLKVKLSRLGNVNLEAVAELEALEPRLATLEAQMNDLSAANRHLQSVIGRINDVSRRLFLETFTAVREHFQTMVRKLFGGGKGDLVLEDENDVLESGVEIITRPPGKEPKSISQLSGGEKTLAAVALLLALFRAKPSPFCVLDEVDAALDEANIGRFVDVVKEMLSESQVILITHSKTTMACASVLHGITQREPGVSLRVSVRLEDVASDGTLLHTEPPRARSA